ncbi:M15 family metallopeptidase [Pseudoneobacillus sp. C159]
MKKLMLLGFISLLFMTTACSRVESMMDHLPFIKNIVKEPEKKPGQASEPKETIEKKNESEKQADDTQLTLEDIFFNQIKDANGEKVIMNPENTLALVNKQYSLPETFLPNDLTRPEVDFSFGDLKIEKSLLRKEAASALEKLFQVAKQNGIELFAVSGYRSYQYQHGLFETEVKKVGREKAMAAVAFPGQSEHQTGLAMDITSRSANMELTEDFGTTEEGKWLAENAHRFGFILRYPKGKESITGYQYEAWHFRYIGVDAATAIYEHNLTLEEYFQIVKKI